ncbi:MAG: CHAT domain-containing protein [Bacteroidota bacterium]
MIRFLLYFYKATLITLAFLLNNLTGYSKCGSSKNIWDKLAEISTGDLYDQQNLSAVYILQKEFHNCGFEKDSVYARILDRIAYYEYRVNGDLNTAIRFGLASVSEAKASKKNFSYLGTARTYNNLGYYYLEANAYSKALTCFDTAIMYAKNVAAGSELELMARNEKCIIHFNKGDYQKCIEESTIGLADAESRNNLALRAIFFNQRAQSYNFQSSLNKASVDADSALKISERIQDSFEAASALKTLAIINTKLKKYSEANSFFRQAIKIRSNHGDVLQIADDYIDYGNYHINDLSQFEKGVAYYFEAVKYAKEGNHPDRLSAAYVNVGQTYFRQGNYHDAQRYYLLAMQQLNIGIGNSFLPTKTSRQLNVIPNKELLLVILENKTELLVALYKSTLDRKILTAALKTAEVTDTVIGQIRQEQVGLQSKLYWRNKTRSFYTNAIEACWLANNKTLAFFFMEKSRAVLLNDQLNELGAVAQLAPSDAAKEQALQVNIIMQQQQLHRIDSKPAEEKKLLQTKDELEHFISSLEQRYPLYYQYKYASQVVNLPMLQKFLDINNQQFVHYFINDTVIYVLGISSDSLKFIRLARSEFSTGELRNFIQYCSDKNQLNSHFSDFASLSFRIYSKIFAPVVLSKKGRIIICPDNYLIPFEALSSSSAGTQYLAYDYSFSYVYSANYLLKKFSHSQNGNFLGIAPISFAAGLNVPDLRNSGTAIEKSAAFFRQSNVYSGKNASRKNFLTSFSKFAVVNIFSHALADSSTEEPILYLQDSVIKLSELELINNASAQLVILSACETNIGKREEGEGIYSIARGFAALGVPAVAATLWKVDEESTYAIVTLFNQNLANGLNKDEALQKAKLDFINKNDHEKLLPFYWSSMILVGTAGPLQLPGSSNFKFYFFAAIGLVVFLLFLFRKRKYVVNYKTRFLFFS